jgi:hypothetical protein
VKGCSFGFFVTWICVFLIALLWEVDVFRFLEIIRLMFVLRKDRLNSDNSTLVICVCEKLHWTCGFVKLHCVLSLF